MFTRVAWVDLFRGGYEPVDPAAYAVRPRRRAAVATAVVADVVLLLLLARLLPPSFAALGIILATLVAVPGMIMLPLRRDAAPVVVDAPGVYVAGRGLVPWPAISAILLSPDGDLVLDLGDWPGDHAASPSRHRWPIDHERFTAATAHFAPRVPVATGTPTH
jgi:hypothetical protein